MSSFEVFSINENSKYSDVEQINIDQLIEYLKKALSKDASQIIIKKNFGFPSFGDEKTAYFSLKKNKKYKIVLITPWNTIFREKEFNKFTTVSKYILSSINNTTVKKIIVLK